MIIRVAITKDVEAMMDIFNYSILYTTTVYSYEAYDYNLMKSWFDQKQLNKLPILIAEIEGKIVGYATYGSFRDRPAYHTTAEHSVYVHQDFQQRGIGKNYFLN